MRKNKKLFCCSQIVLVRGLFEGFFWPEEGRRPSEGQKNPENSPKAKTSLAKAKQVFFVLLKDEKCRALTLKCHFFKYSKLFPLQKVKFLVPKIPIKKKLFCAAKQGKQECARGIKSELYLKKNLPCKLQIRA